MKVIVQIALTIVLSLEAFSQQRGLGVQKHPAQSAPEQRVALVIGNSDYKDSPLVNPINDARDMARSLAQVGFVVIQKENLSQNEMKKAIRDFGERIRNGGVGLFYYAGHAMQVNGHNYLIPTQAAISTEPEVEYETVDVGFVLAQMASAGNPLNILILDACRNNPFTRSFRSAVRGLAYMEAPIGTIIAYATGPGSVASDGNSRNGLYTQELLNYMSMPGLKIEDVFKRVRLAVQKKSEGNQIPWESSSLTSDFYFSGLSVGNAATGTQLATPKMEPTISKESAPSTTDLEADRNISGVWVLYNGDTPSRSTIYTFLHSSVSDQIFYDAAYSSGSGRIVERTLSINYVRKDGQPTGKLNLQMRDSSTLIGSFTSDDGTSGQVELRRQQRALWRDTGGQSNLTGLWRNLQADASSLSTEYRIVHSAQSWEVTYQAEKSSGKGAFVGNRLIMIWTRPSEELPAGLIELVLISPRKLTGYYTKNGQKFELELTKQ